MVHSPLFACTAEISCFLWSGNTQNIIEKQIISVQNFAYILCYGFQLQGATPTLLLVPTGGSAHRPLYRLAFHALAIAPQSQSSNYAYDYS